MQGIPVGLGTALFGTTVSREDSFRLLDAYASWGGRVIDTANMYACWLPGAQGGESESVIGRWLGKHDRSAFTVMTKIGSQLLPGQEGARPVEGLSAKAVQHAVNASLARLKTDTIDILLAHHDDLNTPLRETWEAFGDLVAAGKVKHIGISNYSPQRVGELSRLIHEQSLVPIDFVQLKYSLIAPEKGTDLGKLVLLDTEMKETLARVLPKALIFAYTPLLGGKVFEGSADEVWPSGYDNISNRRTVAAIRCEAGKLGVAPAAYVLKQISDQGIWPITATGSPERLEANLALFRV